MNLKDEKILSAFEEKQSITGVHKITGYNWQQGIIYVWNCCK